jgi:hypothetical protein
MPLQVIYIATGHHGALRLQFDRIQPLINADAKDRELHRVKVKILGRWLDQIDPLAPSNGPHGVRRIRLSYSFTKLMATEAAELAHLSPSAMPFAQSLLELTTDRCCWLASEGL